MKAKRSRKAASVLLRGENVSLILFSSKHEKALLVEKLMAMKKSNVGKDTVSSVLL